jgi:hypothetical protein
VPFIRQTTSSTYAFTAGASRTSVSRRRRTSAARTIFLGVRAVRQLGGRRHDAQELEDVRVRPPQPVLELGKAGDQDARVRPRIDREDGLVIAHQEAAILVLELQLAVLEHPAVVVAEDGQEDPVAQLGLERLPVDVEEGREARGGAVLEHVLPPGVPRPDDAHVVGDDVDQQTHAARPEGVGERLVTGASAQRLAHHAVVSHVVAVGVRHARLEDRGEVAVAYPEVVEVRHQLPDIRERQARPELEPVRRGRGPHVPLRGLRRRSSARLRPSSGY